MEKKYQKQNCRKIKYKDKIEAMIALADCTKRSAKSHHMENRIYYCQECHAWHLTSGKFGKKRKLWKTKK